MQSYIPLNPTIFDTIASNKPYTIKHTYKVEKDMKKQKEPKEYDTEVETFTGTLVHSLPNHNVPQIQFKDNDGCYYTIAGGWEKYEICPTG